MRILIVDDDKGVRDTLQRLFQNEYDVLVAGTGEQAVTQMEKVAVDLVITDNKMPGMSGLDLIRKGKILAPNTAFVLITAYATIEQAVEAIQIGADDFVMKPFDLNEMEHRVKRIQELHNWNNERALKSENSQGTDRLLGRSKNIEDAKAFVKKVADVPSPVLVLGATGSGKEVMARAIHECSPRKDRSFIAVNCASLSEQLMESELFGHEKGAFTGADKSKPGKFELAAGGTLFLDEMGELSLEIQAKLLRVLQEKEFYRVGGTKNIKSNARVVAATHRDLKKMVSEGSFREDLYFRLNVLTFEMKPLSERKEDIRTLAEFFWSQTCQEMLRNSRLSEEALQVIENYSFPGNIRELKNTLERLIVLGPKEGEIPPELLPQEFREQGGANKVVSMESTPSAIGAGPSFPLKEGHSLTEQVDQLESFLIHQAMNETNQNQVQAAKKLGIKRATLQYKLKKFEEALKKAA